MSDNTSVPITVWMKPESVDELLAGEWAFRVWLERQGDDYALRARVPADHAASEAMLRVALGEALEGEPPIPEPSIDVEEQMDRLKARLGWDAE